MNPTRGVIKTPWKLLCSINRHKGFSPVAPTIVNKNKGFLLLRLGCRTAWEQALFIYLAFFCVLPAREGKSSILLPPCPCRRCKNAEKNLNLFWRLLETESLYCVISSYSVTLSKTHELSQKKKDDLWHRNSPTFPIQPSHGWGKGWTSLQKWKHYRLFQHRILVRIWSNKRTFLTWYEIQVVLTLQPKEAFLTFQIWTDLDSPK